MLRVKNFTRSFLSSSISAAASQLSVSSGTGADFPLLSSGDYVFATIIHPQTSLHEIVRITDIVGDTFTVLRAQDDTPARSFPIASEISVQWNKQQVLDWVIQENAASVTAQINAAVAAAIASSSSNVPSGGCIFSLTMNPLSPPAGWLYCDGTGGAPDLRGRFPLGAGGGIGAATFATGGEATHVLTIDEMPAHAHNMDALAGSNTTSSNAFWNMSNNNTAGQRAVLPEGGGQAHNNVPPYIAGNWFMKA